VHVVQRMILAFRAAAAPKPSPSPNTSTRCQTPSSRQAAAYVDQFAPFMRCGECVNANRARPAAYRRQRPSRLCRTRRVGGSASAARRARHRPGTEQYFGARIRQARLRSQPVGRALVQAGASRSMWQAPSGLSREPGAQLVRHGGARREAPWAAGISASSATRAGTAAPRLPRWPGPCCGLCLTVMGHGRTFAGACCGLACRYGYGTCHVWSRPKTTKTLGLFDSARVRGPWAGA